MGVLEIILLGIGLSMDSVAVSLTGGAVIRNCTPGNIFKIASFMGLFQGGMTIVGYLFGLSFAKYITDYDHWIAFLLLSYLGIKMIYDCTCNDEKEEKSNPLDNKVLTCMAVATSIDALAVGVSFALLYTSIIVQASTIGVITFLLSALGVYFGSRFGKRINLKLDLIGGIILIGIGTKILIEHTLLT